MIEYEYSHKMKDITPFIKYCVENQYTKEMENFQTRELYHNKNGILARITTNIVDGVSKTNLNFKDEDESDKSLKVSRESVELEVNESNIDFVNSMLNILDFTKTKTLKRTRYVYENKNVKFEIDDYIEPKMKVLAIEGEKEEVDIVYNTLKDTIEALKEN
ncbi:MAG: hypothetical protein RR988_04255, partial [Clostridia bacterium]